MRTDKFLTPIMRSSRLFSIFFGLALLIAFSQGCAPSSTTGDGRQDSSGSGEVPELTEEIIRERINDAWIEDVPAESNAAKPIPWHFDEDEPKEIAVVDKQISGERATIVLDIKTRSAPYARNQWQLAGQIRTFWELRTGWVLRRWEIDRTENISMKYKDLPKPSPSTTPNANR
jgi:hypothetical protein